MKKIFILCVSLALIVIGAVWFVGTTGGTFPRPKVLDSNDKGMLLSLPVVAIERNVEWSPEWVAASEPGHQAVKQALRQLTQEMDGAPMGLTVVANKGLFSREQIAQRMGEALSQSGLGRYQLRDADPKAQQKIGVVINVAVSDTAMAQKLLGALSPYLGGRVALMYTQQSAGQMTLELHGTPFFNGQGQATFDPNLVNLAE